MRPRTAPLALIALFALTLAFSATPVFASEHGGGGGEKVKDGPMYVDFKNIVVPIIKKNGSTGVIALSMMAEVKDEKAKTDVTDRMPKLRDAFIRALYGNLEGNRFVREDGALDIERIKTRLMKSAQYVMKDDKEILIKDLLFQNIAQQTY